MTRALVPGTFDPVTNGHMDVIIRASQIFDEVVVGVALSTKKHTLFDVDTRVSLVQQAVRENGADNITVMGFDTLLVDFAHKVDARVVVKGLRATTDFEYEFQMTAMNYQLDKDIETMFIMSPPKYMYLSSSIVRELAELHGDISSLVPACVESALLERFSC
jgi:pantetheine-phosphate adenylyltransferase